MEFRSMNRSTPPIVLNLIIINVLFFFAQLLLGGNSGFIGELLNKLALFPIDSGIFQPYQLISYMFLHAGFSHLLLNMFGLWMFGSLMENLWGPKRFLIFYVVCGLAAGIAQLLLGNGPAVGASGAIMGLLVAYGYTFPNTQLFVFPIPFPIKAKWAVIGILALDIFGGLSNSPEDNIAHFAHLGGAVIGFIIVLYWNKTNRQRFY
jgi:membrane associated rhomboid family serine protease